LNLDELPSILFRAAELGVDSVDLCPLDGDHPGYDFMRYPELLDEAKNKPLAEAIRDAFRVLPGLETSGFDRVLQCIEGPSVMQCRGAT
jgi:hypothetical protein